MRHLGSKHNNRKLVKFRVCAQTPNSTICDAISRSNSPKRKNLVGGNVVHTKYHTARTCTVKTSSCSNTVDNGDQSFVAAGPRLWNSLPAGIHQPDNDTGNFVGS